MANFNTRLVALASKHKLVQAETALLFNISETSVHRYTHGAVPSPRKLDALEARLTQLEKQRDIKKTPQVRGVKAEPKTLSRAFMKARLYANMSVDTASDILGCSYEDLSNFESGIRTWLDNKDIEAFINVYGKPSAAATATSTAVQVNRTLRTDTTALVHELAAMQQLDLDRTLKVVLQFLQFSLSEGTDFSEIASAFSE